MTLRQKRVNSYIMKMVPEIIEKEVNDPRIGLVTITSVDSSPDLKHATIYFTVHGGEKSGKSNSDVLNHASGFIQHELARRIKMKNTPILTFRYRPMTEKAQKIEELLKKEGEEIT
jgi:ribosome-binding factor A